MTTRLVTSEQLADYQELCSLLARRYNGLFGAEYDDLFQEGWMTCLEALQAGRLPLRDIVAKRMTRWVNRCANQWMSYDKENPLLA